MKVEPVEQIEWKGIETVAAARGMVLGHRPVEIHLPANYHHALFVRLRSSNAPAQPEMLDITGGPELLTEIARIDGLKDFDDLAPTVSETGSRIHVVSPSPKIAIIPVATED